MRNKQKLTNNNQMDDTTKKKKVITFIVAWHDITSKIEKIYIKP
jgi:hypothetical protein